MSDGTRRGARTWAAQRRIITLRGIVPLTDPVPDEPEERPRPVPAVRGTEPPPEDPTLREFWQGIVDLAVEATLAAYAAAGGPPRIADTTTQEEQEKEKEETS